MNMKRMRGRSHRGGGSGPSAPRSYNGNFPLNRNHVFDSSGPDLRIRGTAQQLFEKYLQLGRDATGAGDRVMAESYFQHAEHYFRILNAINQAQGANNGANQPQLHGGNGPYNNGYRRPPADQYESEENGAYAEAGTANGNGEGRDIPIAATASDS
jgi:hypothetical protein